MDQSQADAGNFSCVWCWCSRPGGCHRGAFGEGATSGLA